MLFHSAAFKNEDTAPKLSYLVTLTIPSVKVPQEVDETNLQNGTIPLRYTLSIQWFLGFAFPQH